MFFFCFSSFLLILDELGKLSKECQIQAEKVSFGAGGCEQSKCMTHMRKVSRYIAELDRNRLSGLYKNTPTICECVRVCNSRTTTIQLFPKSFVVGAPRNAVVWSPSVVCISLKQHIIEGIGPEVEELSGQTRVAFGCRQFR